MTSDTPIKCTSPVLEGFRGGVRVSRECAGWLELAECSRWGSRAESELGRGGEHPLVIGNDPVEVSCELPGGREMDRAAASRRSSADANTAAPDARLAARCTAS